MAQTLAMIVNARQDDGSMHLLHVEFAYSNSISPATCLAPNEVNMGRLPQLPLTIFDRTGGVGHQSLASDHLANCDLATHRQKRANDIVHAHHALADARRPAPNVDTGGWGMGVKFFLYHPPGYEGEHRRQSTQEQARA